MPSRRLFALILMLAAIAAALGELCGWLLPTLSWPFSASRELVILRVDWRGEPFYWFGWLCVLLAILLSLRLFWIKGTPVSADWAQKWKRFRSLKRGYYSFILLLLIVVTAGLDQCLVGHRPLALSYEGKLYFPAFTRAIYHGEDFGQTGEAALAEADYQKLQAGAVDGLDWLLMPPIPYSPSRYSGTPPTQKLELREGKLYEPTDAGLELYNGQASRLFDTGQTHLRYRYRHGLLDGSVQGWSQDRREVYYADYDAGSLVTERYTGDMPLVEYLALSSTDETVKLYYPPTPPLIGGHWLGTNSQGFDIVAYLFAGLQVNIKAVLFYLPFVYLIGVTVGMLMGFIGGKFDLLTQRAIEIVAQLPFLFVVMVLVDFVPSEMRGMLLILLLLVAFGWMQMTYVIRTTTMKEKSRDYVAASRLMGASSFHILRQHILPSLTPIIVTLIPFSVALVILSLASMDYLGFGLPDSYATWGRLLNDGLGKLNAPWVASAAFGALVLTLLLISFIGEAIREAFDPKKHSYYR